MGLSVPESLGYPIPVNAFLLESDTFAEAVGDQVLVKRVLISRQAI